jgi:hypothetical protein
MGANTPLFCTIFQSLTPVTVARTLLNTGNQNPKSLLSSTVTSEIFSWCALVVTNRCPGERGIISRNAMHSSALRTRKAGGETRSGSGCIVGEVLGREEAYVLLMRQKGQLESAEEGSNVILKRWRRELLLSEIENLGNLIWRSWGFGETRIQP